jgi:protein involved in polysaccharide export with SLBB domain
MARELPLVVRARTQMLALNQWAGFDLSREPISLEFLRMRETMALNRGIRDRISNHTKLAAWAMVIAVAVGGCSAGSSKSQSERDQFASKPMTPEQCAANADIEKSAESAPQQDSDYRIQPGDQLALDFYMNSEFNDTATVDPNGKIELRMVGPVQAAGLTPSQLAKSIDNAYRNELRNPGAVVHLNNLPSRQIYVEGEVQKPGGFPLQPGMTAVQALALAGGVTDSSDPQSAVLIRRDACGQPQGTKIDLAAVTSNPGSADDVALMPRDVVVVPKSGIANADLWVKQHIRDILPVEPYISPTF